MDHLVAKDAAIEIVYKLAYTIDDLDRESITALFRQDVPFTMDISAILGIPAKEMTADDYYKLACSGLGGFNATHHLLGCPIVTLPADNSAHVKVYVSAFHAMETDGILETVTARVTWHFDLELHKGGWFIRKFVIKRSAPLDNPELMHKAHKRVEEGYVRKAKE